MSRHAKGKRSNGNVDSDYCPTPSSCARAILGVLPILPSDVVVDVGAGNGVFAAAAHQLYGVHPIAVEAFASRYPRLHELRTAGIVRRVVARRYETWLPEPAQRADWTIGNPPFRQAETFLRHAFFTTKRGGYIAMLLRSGFTVTGGRTRLFREDPPAYIYALQTRPTFYVPNTGEGDEDEAAAAEPDEVEIQASDAAATKPEADGNATTLKEEVELRGKADSSEYVAIVWRVGFSGLTLWSPLAWDLLSDIEQAADAVDSDRARIRQQHWPTYGERGAEALARLTRD